MEGGIFQLLFLLFALIGLLASALRKYRQAESRRLRPAPSAPPEAYEGELAPPIVPPEERVPPPLPPLLQRLREEMERMAPPPEPVKEEVRGEPPVEEPPPEERTPPPAVPETVSRAPMRQVRSPFGRLTSDTVTRGIVLAEILGPCRAQRPYEFFGPEV